MNRCLQDFGVGLDILGIEHADKDGVGGTFLQSLRSSLVFFWLPEFEVYRILPYSTAGMVRTVCSQCTRYRMVPEAAEEKCVTPPTSIFLIGRGQSITGRLF